eukprot:TRINITY_DN5725_c0_g2_i1.p1 TRINITY_DN5725_c0_g2~~TRINITY_DN5725_c0_g2_i1.p1  ORF type:complete len:273 (-),score=38.28 TRINITY_DN5725_c0_g2_i1:79-897(-)
MFRRLIANQRRVLDSNALRFCSQKGCQHTPEQKNGALNSQISSLLKKRHHHSTSTGTRVSPEYEKLLSGNRSWVAAKTKNDPDYFQRLSAGQTPSYMLIGCSDSRAPPDQLTQTGPGEMFIHRNVANMVVNTDMNVMSVLQYAVEVLKVKHVIVMGHYNCGGIKAALGNQSHGLIDKWLSGIKDVARLHRTELDSIADPEMKFRRLVELNVREQVTNLCKTDIVQKAWAAGANLEVHGWVYDIFTGLIKEVEKDHKSIMENLDPVFRYDLSK